MGAAGPVHCLSAYREAAWAVASGRCDVAMALGFEKMTELVRGAGAGRGVGRDTIDSVILPAAYFALWATRRMHRPKWRVRCSNLRRSATPR